MASAHDSGHAVLIGTVLSRRFRVTREIGRGGMGAVYAAEPVLGGAEVAVKVLHPYFVADAQVLTRFMEEAATSMRLDHPNILRVRECLAAEDGNPYLVMDLLAGVPLSSYTKEGGRVALAQAIPIVQGVLAGLMAAHAAGVVHRDLKPGNVFLSKVDDVFCVKLLDFGIAKVMDAAGGMGTKTRAGALLGTPAYMSPEQVKSAKDVDARTDLWSVGVMFYEMLSGRVAFAAPTEYARLAAVLSAQPRPIESVDPELAIVAPFLARALEKDRDRRFQTAREMLDELSQLMPASALASPRSLLPDVPTLSHPRPSGGSLSISGSRKPPSGWSLVTDKTPRPADRDEAPSTIPQGEPRDVLTAAVQAGHSSTLASPNRGPSVAPPAPVARVSIVPESELPSARLRAEARASTIPPPRPHRGVAVPTVAMLVTVALALGFTLGVLFGRTY